MEKNTLIISDLHLTHLFDKKKFNYLVNLFKKADRLIINGDLWSYFMCDFVDFIESGWKKLFPLMLEKDCVYVHGNHDRKEWCNENTNLFSVKSCEKYSFEQNGQLFNIQHGHRNSGKFAKNKTIIKGIRKYKIDNTSYAIQKTILNKFGEPTFAKIGAVINKTHKKYIKKHSKNQEIFIRSHTHSPEFSLDKRYINTGFISFGFGSYLLVNDEISLVKERYL
jgi:predicted phosphodiesterase